MSRFCLWDFCHKKFSFHLKQKTAKEPHANTHSRVRGRHWKKRLLLTYCTQANLPLQLLRYNNNCLFKWIEEGTVFAAQIPSTATYFSSDNIFHIVRRGAIPCERGYPMQVSLYGSGERKGEGGQLQGPDCRKYLRLWFNFFFFHLNLFLFSHRFWAW